jgi:predicted transcriptional regulator
MAMGIVSDKDFGKELDNLNPQREVPKSSNSAPPIGIKDVEIRRIERGRPEGAIEVPNSIRRLIGDESATNGRQSALELASTLGISPSSASAYAKGATSTSTYRDRPNVDVINQAKLRVSNRARKRLMMALSHITEEKLQDAKVRDIAGVARDMSQVIKNMEPEKESNSGQVNNGPTFVFYSPKVQKEESFDVIHVKE